MKINQHFIGRLLAFANQGEGNSVVEEHVVLELTELSKEGVEIGFNDRNERVYLKFSYADLVRAIEGFNDE